MDIPQTSTIGITKKGNPYLKSINGDKIGEKAFEIGTLCAIAGNIVKDEFAHQGVFKNTMKQNADSLSKSIKNPKIRMAIALGCFALNSLLTATVVGIAGELLGKLANKISNLRKSHEADKLAQTAQETYMFKEIQHHQG